MILQRKPYTKEPPANTPPTGKCIRIILKLSDMPNEDTTTDNVSPDDVQRMLQGLSTQPNLFNPFQGHRPHIPWDQLELNQRLEAAFSLMRDPTTPAEEFKNRSDDTMRMLGERMRRAMTLSDKHDEKPVASNSDVQLLPSITLPIIEPPFGPEKRPICSPSALDYSTAGARLNTETSIRILNIDLPERTTPESDLHKPITCSMSVVDLAENPVYHALSYTWGDPRETYPSPEDILPQGAWENRPWTITCSGSPIAVGTNLYTALLALRWTVSSDPLQSLNGFPIWVDKICQSRVTRNSKSVHNEMAVS